MLASHQVAARRETRAERNAFRVRLIGKDDPVREHIFRLRYRIYVEQMRRVQNYADHERRRIEEPLDATAYLLGAFVGDELVGTLRVNLARDGGLGYYSDFYDMDSVGAAHPAATSITTKLMVLNHRLGCGVELGMAAYRFGRPLGVRHDFMDCNTHLVPFFERLGYKHTRSIVHPEYGPVHGMRLDIEDLDHLRSVGSPLADLEAA